MKHNGILRLATLLKLSTLIIAARTECECGRSGKFHGTLKRIVNGVQTAPHEYPWMALLLYRGKAYCGGSVINNYYILTAAHCAVRKNVRWMEVALGVHDRITMDNGKARIQRIARVFVHPKHVDRKYFDENDVALLKLYKPIQFDNFVRPVCLPYKGEVFTRKVAVVTGWGAKKYDGGYTTRFLQKVTVQMLSNCECLKSKVGNLFWKIFRKDGGSQAICAYERNVDSCQECECGRSGTRKRIVNGEQTAPHEYPWMALLLYRDKAYCGGSVINNYYILTAAHCAVRKNVRWMHVALGVHDRITMDNGKARIHTVARVFVHPKHVDRKYFDENDVALLKLYKPIQFDNLVRPVCLPYKGEVFTRKVAVVTGWGAKKYDSGYTTRFLQKVTVQVLSNCECLKSKVGNLFWKIFIKDGGSQAICAYERNVDSCQGDSGGPLVTTVKNDLMVQIGVVSFGKRCGDISSPGVYAQVTNYLDWIRNVTIDAEYCTKPAYKPITYEDNDAHYDI